MFFLILIANAYFLAKYLFKYEYAQRLIISIVGIGSYKKGADQVYSNPNELLSDWKIASGMMTSKKYTASASPTASPTAILIFSQFHFSFFIYKLF